MVCARARSARSLGYPFSDAQSRKLERKPCAVAGLSREPYANGQKINQIFKSAFLRVGMRPFSAHTLRKTHAMLMDKTCNTMEDCKAFSQNMGHEHLATTISAYMPVTLERQREIIRNLRESAGP